MWIFNETKDELINCNSGVVVFVVGTHNGAMLKAGHLASDDGVVLATFTGGSAAGVIAASRTLEGIVDGLLDAGEPVMAVKNGHSDDENESANASANAKEEVRQ